jgi:hypothetical protein
LSRSTPLEVVWQKLRRMSGKCRSITVPGLSVNGVAITTQCDVSTALASSFASASSSDRYDHTFLRIKGNGERSPLHVHSQNHECYNAPFSMDERILAIGRSRNSFPSLMSSKTRCCLTPPLLQTNFSYPCLTGFVRGIASCPPGEAIFHPSIDQSVSVSVFAKQWNAWSTTALSLSWRRKFC